MADYFHRVIVQEYRRNSNIFEVFCFCVAGVLLDMEEEE